MQALAKQVAKHAPFASFECLTNVKIPGVETTPLKHGWPGWWAKMNLFDPDYPGNFLYVDLDTAVVGPLDEFQGVRHLTLLRDFYRDGKKLKEGLGSGLMYLPSNREAVWKDWISHPERNMRLHPRGDQFFLESHYLNVAARWQDALPSQVVSWKVNCKNDIVPPEARVVCFHGKPRPWEVGKFQHLYR